MNNRREMVMRELELTPLWRLRDQGSGVRGQESEIRSEGSSQVMATTQTANAGVVDRRIAVMAMDWSMLKATVSNCTACPLHAARNKTVFGVGDEKAAWFFVGEGPGADEDMQGEPFVGQAGKLLDNMLAAIDLKRGSDVYIANIVKCRPPKNRNPEPAEAASCEPFLRRQIDLIQPLLIVALGKVAAQNLLGTDAAIASLRGRLHRYEGIPVIITYHPAYLLRSLTDKARAWEDLCFARETMADLKSVVTTPTSVATVTGPSV